MRTAAICPTCATYTNAVCVIYDGPYLSNLDINPMSSLDDVLQQINFVAGGFEKTSNKSINIVADQSSNIKYPSVKAVYNWATSTFEPALGFTPENVANKSTNTSLGTSNILYPTQNAVKTYVDTSISAIDLQQVLDVGSSAIDKCIGLEIPSTQKIMSLCGNRISFTNDISGESVKMFDNKIEFYDGGTGTRNLSINVGSGTTTNYLPNANGVLATSVNNISANTSGNIDLPFKQIKVSLSSAQILTLGSSPVTLVPAQGAGKVVVPISVVLNYNFVTSAYSTNTNVFITSTSSPTSITRTGVLAFTNDACTFDVPINSGASNPLTGNEALEISTGSGNPTGGDSTLDVYVTYYILSI